MHSDVNARLMLYSSESDKVDLNRQQVAAAELKPLVYYSLYCLIVLQTDFFHRLESCNVAITVTGSTKNNAPVVSMTEALDGYVDFPFFHQITSCPYTTSCSELLIQPFLLKPTVSKSSALLAGSFQTPDRASPFHLEETVSVAFCWQ